MLYNIFMSIYIEFLKELANYDIDGDKRITAALVPCGSPEESKAMLKQQQQEIQEFGYVKTLACASEEYSKVIKRIQELFSVSKQTAFLVLGILDHLDGVPGDGIQIEELSTTKYALPAFLKELDLAVARIQKHPAIKIPLDDYDVLESNTSDLVDELRTLKHKLS